MGASPIQGHPYAYWTKAFQDAGLPEPKVGYSWIPAGQTAASACGDESGTPGDRTAAYCPGDDTIYISEKFAADINAGALDEALPGSSHGYGRTAGDFAVAYIVAHEYAHQVQDELGLFERYGSQVPTRAFELQADCYAGTWANSAQQEERLEEGDVQEALDAALAVGDFGREQPGSPRHARGAGAGLEPRVRVRRSVLVQAVPGPWALEAPDDGHEATRRDGHGHQHRGAGRLADAEAVSRSRPSRSSARGDGLRASRGT